MLLESEVQDLAEEQPAQAHVLMDHLTQPLQLYQNASKMAENRTSFLSKVRVVYVHLWSTEATTTTTTVFTFPSFSDPRVYKGV